MTLSLTYSSMASYDVFVHDDMVSVDLKVAVPCVAFRVVCDAPVVTLHLQGGSDGHPSLVYMVSQLALIRHAFPGATRTTFVPTKSSSFFAPDSGSYVQRRVRSLFVILLTNYFRNGFASCPISI